MAVLIEELGRQEAAAMLERALNQLRGEGGKAQQTEPLKKQGPLKIVRKRAPVIVLKR